ncbi:MAG: hypothetical protein P1P90_01960 [Patescibacteria group bacterium]|nr:hypothetical protein [Patescibacteria group bacterium]
MKLTHILPIFLILAIFGAGCEQSNNEPRTTKSDLNQTRSIDPCELVDQSEVDALFGVGSTIIEHDTEPRNATGQKLCVYDVPSDDAVTMVQIGVQESKDMVAGMTAEELFNSQKDFLDGVVEVSYIGDDAYQSSMDFVGGGALYFLAKNKTVLITVDVSLGKLDHAANQAAEQKLAKKILERL